MRPPGKRSRLKTSIGHAVSTKQLLRETKVEQLKSTRRTLIEVLWFQVTEYHISVLQIGEQASQQCVCDFQALQEEVGS